MLEEKQCPYCAETIKSEALKCRFCGSDLLEKNSGQSEPQPKTEPSVALCSKCNVALLSVQKSKMVSLSGFVSLFVFVAGLLTLFFAPLVGVVIIILSIIIGMAGSKKTVMVCPNCGRQGTRIA